MKTCFNRPHFQRCELCPSRSGALKRADSGGWAHVVCALYIPEVRFGNVTSMEPIILQLIPPERYNKVYMHTLRFLIRSLFEILFFFKRNRFVLVFENEMEREGICGSIYLFNLSCI